MRRFLLALSLAVTMGLSPLTVSAVPFCYGGGDLLAAAARAIGTGIASCPFCTAPRLTLSEQIKQADVAVVGKWQSATEADADSAAETVFEVYRQLNGEPIKGELSIPSYRAGDPGDLFLLLASDPASDESDQAAPPKAPPAEAAAADEAVAESKEVKESDESGAAEPLRWSGPVEISPDAVDYLVSAPAPEADQETRLAYFMKYLENADETVSTDAYSEFAKADYEDIVPLADRMDTASLRRWLTDETVTPTRLGLYGMMLGLAGDESDAQLMEKIITEPTEDFRLGVDGIMGGYILLTGEDGLQLVEQNKLVSTDVPFSETYAAMQALRFLWQYEDERIGKDRLKQSMRLLLDRPELADLVIADLSRWKDWSLIDSLDGYYGKEGYEVPAIQRAIIRFYLSATKTKNDPPSDEQQEVAQAKLDQIKEDDPRTYASAERFFFIE